jgi:hypothetical protein
VGLEDKEDGFASGLVSFINRLIIIIGDAVEVYFI